MVRNLGLTASWMGDPLAAGRLEGWGVNGGEKGALRFCDAGWDRVLHGANPAALWPGIARQVDRGHRANGAVGIQEACRRK